MTPAFWQYLIDHLPAIITAFLAGVAAIIGALNSRKIDTNIATANATHKLVNSDHGVALRLSATTLERIADLTKQPTDIAAADAAKVAADNHDATQAQINQDAPVPPKA